MILTKHNLSNTSHYWYVRSAAWQLDDCVACIKHLGGINFYTQILYFGVVPVCMIV